MDGTAIAKQPETLLPRLIEQAAAALASATTAAEILDARDRANVAYTAAKMAARLAKAKQAHDEIIAACQKAMADALLIEERAQRRLADEYDAAQARGEVAKHSSGNPQIVPNKNDLPPTAADLGLSRKVIYEARRVRDAEKASPGIIRETLDNLLQAGEQPTRAHVKRAVDEVLNPPKPEPAKASAVVARDLHYQGISRCSFCGQDFGEDVKLWDDPLQLYPNHHENIDAADAAICFDCAEDAYFSLLGSQRLAAKKAKASKDHPTKNAHEENADDKPLNSEAMR
jgi:hypothetical protein